MPKQFGKWRKDQDEPGGTNVKAFLTHQALSFLTRQQEDAIVKHTIRNNASREEIRRIMFKHDRNAAGPSHPPEFRHEARALPWVDVMHDADRNHGIERMIGKREPIAVVHLIGNAGVALGCSCDAFGRKIDALQRAKVIDPMGMVVADAAAHIEQVDLGRIAKMRSYYVSQVGGLNANEEIDL